METAGKIKLSRDAEVVEIPSGVTVTLAEGSEVRVMQSFGGNYTMLTDSGHMVRLRDADADAIGREPTKEPTGEVAKTAEECRERVYEALKNCYDPEIPVNIVDLGLIYTCDVAERSEGGYKAAVTMTLTAPGCGMGEVIRLDAEHRIQSVPGIEDVDIRLVLDPPWDPSRMSDSARLELGML